MAEALQTKTRLVRKKNYRKDGTYKEYVSTETYQVKGYVGPDGKVTKFSPTQMDEMKNLYKLEVPITKIAKKFNTTSGTISKIVK